MPLSFRLSINNIKNEDAVEKLNDLRTLTLLSGILDNSINDQITLDMCAFHDLYPGEYDIGFDEHYNPYLDFKTTSDATLWVLKYQT